MFTEANGAVTFAVKVIPRASKNQIVGVEGDSIKIRLSAPPVEGKANVALIECLAEMLDIARSQIEIVSGHSARRKIVRVRGITAKQVEEALCHFDE